MSLKPLPKDHLGNDVLVGSRVRLLKLSGNWFEQLPPEEKLRVSSMIGEIFEVEEIDEYGSPWIRKSWHDEQEGTYLEHSIALDAQEMELV
jgi:hypothetical protein